MTSIGGIVMDDCDLGDASPALASSGVSPAFDGASEGIVPGGVFSIFDQGVVSGTNFFTTLMIARTCSLGDLGVYSLAWTVVVFVMAVQGNLITVPYTIYCHRPNGPSPAEYAGSTLVHQLIASLGAMACFLGLAVLVSLGCGPAGLRAVAWVLVGVIPLLLLREYVRRFTMAHLALATAVTLDVVVALLQMGILLALHRLGWLSVATAYGALGAACAAACLCWWLLDHQPMRFSRQRFAADWRRNWSFGRWALMSQLSGLAYYLLPWMLAAVRGEAETGKLAACTTLVGLSNLFVMGLNNFLMPKAARAFAEQGGAGLAGVLRRAVLWSVVVLGGLCLITLLAGNPLVAIVYGRQYAGAGRLIAVLALATVADAMALTASTGLWAMDRPGVGIIGDVVQLVVTLGTAIWLVSPSGAMGIAVAILVGRLAGAAVRWSTWWLLIGPRNFEPSVA